MHEDTKSKLHMKNAVQSLHTLLRNINITIKLKNNVVLYGSENLSNTFRQKHGLKLFNKRVMRRISYPRWRKQQSRKNYMTDEIQNLFCSPDIRMIKSRRVRWTRYIMPTR